ncbi:MAG TPA: phospholipase C, phosphocholine-specific [Polyangiaceae bacterium]|nr:phospholipase C, phosphocholine-specific [Polyangiaceae bacterium]
MKQDRRQLLKMAGAGALAAAFPESIRRALAVPAHHRSGTIKDVEHVVFLMQENRSFDHYFGAMRGVRGFGDKHPARLTTGKSVWHQPDGAGYVLPFHPDAANLGMQYLVDLPHGWGDTQAALNGGQHDAWIPNKSPQTMAYLKREDIPFHYALADAFTVCDAYHCSFLGATDPNRYHMWTGWVGNDGKGGGPVLGNDEAGYDWHTYPERLEAHGISWKIYQDVGEGLDAEHFWGWGPPFIGNYGDNSLLYFHQYQNAPEGSPLALKARTGTDIKTGGTLFDQFRADVAANKLPQVSWIVAPEAYSEHGNWPSNFGAWYAAQMLEALWANPEVWSKTVFFYMFDENDGFFDHMVPPTPPTSRAAGLSTVSTVNEIFPGDARHVAGPIGLGVRVPMLVISPWSKGGWVNSELCDHTSLIRFLEARFGDHRPGLIESNITPWRRAVTGDLTSAFDFKKPSPGVVALPSTSGYAPPDYDNHPDYVPAVPATQALPKQEPGVRPARALPYELHALADVDTLTDKLTLRFDNRGQRAAVLQVRSGNNQHGPWTYTVGAHAHLADEWDYGAMGQDSFDLAVHGPNGFYRLFQGGLRGKRGANLLVTAFYDREPGITLEIVNRSRHPEKLRIYEAYSKQRVSQVMEAGAVLVWHWSLEDSFGWYDLTVTADSDARFRTQLAGHVETGRDSVSDPALGV